MKNIITILILIVIITGCECVPGIDTKKVIEPVNHSKIFVFNAIRDASAISIYAGDFELYSNLERYEAVSEYKKFPLNESGYLSVWNEDKSFRFINLPINLEKNIHYSLFLYGTQDNPEFVLLEDKKDSVLSEGNLRFVNLTNTGIMIKTSCLDNGAIFLLSSQHSGIINAVNTECDISIYDSDILIEEFSQSTSSGELVTIPVLNTKISPKYKIISINHSL